MKIAIAGTGGTGKSTLVRDILTTWPNYITTSTTYRDFIKELKLPHSKLCTQDTQWRILNLMLDELQKYSKDDNVIFDRCPLDNIVYSLWSETKQTTDIDEKFIEKCIPLVRESMRLLDIIFFVPLTNVAPILIENDGFRETDAEYIGEIDNIFKALKYQYDFNCEKTPFFPLNDTLSLIHI
jgi:predicted ATPase